MNSGPSASSNSWNAPDLAALLPFLTPGERAELDALIRPPLWEPLPGPQAIAFHHPADVIGYGGSAGGGKTDVAIGLALLRHTKSLIMRREAKNLQAIIDRCRELLGTAGSFNANTGVWRLPGGKQLEFGGCKDPGDEQSYRGRPHDLIVFDEADQFTELMVRFISGWLRTTNPKQHCQILINFNPPSSAEGEWLLSYFAPWIDEKHPDPAKPAELRWYATVGGKEEARPDGEPFTHDGETIAPKSRTFIPARLIDNPHLMATNYGATLQALPEPLRSQLLYGDFTVGREDDAWQVIPTAWVRAAQARWTPTPPQGQALTAVGADVARGGADCTAVAPRFGPWFAPVKKYQGKETDDGPKAANLILREHSGDAPVNIDAIGLGASAYDSAKAVIDRLAVAVNVSEASNEYDHSRKYKLVNVRAAMWWKMREALNPDTGAGLMLPPGAEVLADLTAPRFEVRANGIKVEEKTEIKKRIGRSPDVGDALCLAHWAPTKRRAWVL